MNDMIGNGQQGSGQQAAGPQTTQGGLRIEDRRPPGKSAGTGRPIGFSAPLLCDTGPGVQEEMEKERVRRSGRYAVAPPPAVAAPPIALGDGEQLLEYRKPAPWAYTPLLFGTLLGLVLFALFALSGNAAGMLLGAAIWAGLYLFLRARYWRRAGYWFTSARLLIDDGSRVSMLPYEEIAPSSIVLEGDGLALATVHGKEFVVRGAGDPGKIADFLIRMGRELRAAGPPRPRMD